jgi:hypothetical protein
MSRARTQQEKRRYDRPVLRKRRALAEVTRGTRIVITDGVVGAAPGSTD